MNDWPILPTAGLMGDFVLPEVPEPPILIVTGPTKLSKVIAPFVASKCTFAPVSAGVGLVAPRVRVTPSESALDNLLNSWSASENTFAHDAVRVEPGKIDSCPVLLIFL